MAPPPIEPISHPIRAWVPLGKAQRIDVVTYDPLLYLARLTPVGRATNTCSMWPAWRGRPEPL
jgi:hypothetical protein